MQNIKFLVPHDGRSDINQHTPSKNYKEMIKRQTVILTVWCFFFFYKMDDKILASDNLSAYCDVQHGHSFQYYECTLYWLEALDMGQLCAVF